MRYEELESRFVETSMGKLHFLENGAESKEISLVMLHGLGADARSWKNLVQYIPEYIGIVIVDLLGHGSSDTPKLDYTPKLEAECVAELINSLKLANFVLVGNSYGGWVAAYGCANKIFPKSLNALVLEDSAGLKEEITKTLEKITYEELRSMEIKEALALNNNKDYVIESITSRDNELYLLDEESLKDIDEKTLIIWGEDDKIISSRYAYAFSSSIPNSEVKLIEGAGHIPHFSKPDIFAKLLLNFIK
jgi:pimeloyl-ACP methyl ester carboxylesterase